MLYAVQLYNGYLSTGICKKVLEGFHIFPFPSDPVESVKKFSFKDSPNHSQNEETHSIILE